MEKYAVVEEGNDRLEKFADARGDARCPECGKKAEVHGKTLVCPDHGTESFEAPGAP